MPIEKALEEVYASLHRNNDQLDVHIANLKNTLAEKGEKTILVDPTRLPQNDRQGRKMMQTYFKKRGVMVVFKAKANASTAA